MLNFTLFFHTRLFFFYFNEHLFKVIGGNAVILAERITKTVFYLAVHLKLAELERAGKLRAVVTQNIDGLHQSAGSRTVYELHGTVERNYCIRCGYEYSKEHVMNAPFVPKCEHCGGIVRPDVVLYGEGLDDAALSTASRLISTADVVIVGGTSLTVNPAAALISYFSGKHLIILNKTKTPYDPWAELLIREPIEEVLADVIG